MGVTPRLHDEANLRVHAVHVYFEYVCFIFASSCKRGIIEQRSEESSGMWRTFWRSSAERSSRDVSDVVLTWVDVVTVQSCPTTAADVLAATISTLLPLHLVNNNNDNSTSSSSSSSSEKKRVIWAKFTWCATTLVLPTGESVYN